jgi:hypothetical protein
VNGTYADNGNVFDVTLGHSLFGMGKLTHLN